MKELAGRLVICSILTAPQWSVVRDGDEMARLKEKHSVTEWGNVPRIFWASYNNSVHNVRKLASAISIVSRGDLWQSEDWSDELVLTKKQLGEINGHALLKATGFQIIFPPSQFFWEIDYSLVNDSGHSVACQQKTINEVGSNFTRIVASPEKLRHGYDGITAFILISKAQVYIIERVALLGIVEDIEQSEGMSTKVKISSFLDIAALLTHDVLEKFEFSAAIPTSDEYYSALVTANPRLQKWLQSNEVAKEWNSEVTVWLQWSDHVRPDRKEPCVHH